MNVLLIMPSFFEYHNKIIECMKKKNICVKWYNDSIPFSLSERVFKKVFKLNFKRKFDKYIDNIIVSNKGQKFDKVILIFGGNRFNYSTILKLKKSFSSAQFIYYAWDSIANFPNILEFYNLFDVKYSFDLLDCKRYGMRFLPLFYTEDNIDAEAQIKYDYSIVMSFYIKKARNYNLLCKSIPQDLCYNKCLYLKHKSSFFINKILHPKLYSKYKLNDFIYKPLTKNESDLIFRQSKVIVDCPLENQNGLTIRVFEALYKHKKIITTNVNIKEYEFYSDNNIFIVNDGKKIPIEFFSTPYDNRFEISNDYCIDSFVDKLLCLRGND